ncbi:hypothetical protein [Bacillus paranthracis]|uniref:putative PDDEXK endonuclease n=1 Tax=Bacillus paranthracis TaxID=2026186 RepID=UPI00220307E9|nr:hypothetical protein [Bacillus paranthracis]UXR28888.1 hypothetical protein [Bacillus phage Nachito]
MTKKQEQNQEKPKKKRKNSRAKGSTFERKVAKELTAWWGEEFHRVPASGGLRWGEDNRVVGDIVAPEGSDFPFTIECKKREGWNFEQLIKGTGEVTSWWLQAVTDRERLNDVTKHPLLVFSKNRSPEFYMMEYSLWKKFPTLEKNYFITSFTINNVLHRVVVGFFDELLNVPKQTILDNIA